jgi:hypothetical protein
MRIYLLCAADFSASIPEELLRKSSNYNIDKIQIISYKNQ